MAPRAAKKVKSNPLQLQVNGIPISSVKVRRKLVSGVPVGEVEVVIQDPILGWLPIDATFKVEIFKEEKVGWVGVTLPELISLLNDEMKHPLNHK